MTGDLEYFLRFGVMWRQRRAALLQGQRFLTALEAHFLYGPPRPPDALVPVRLPAGTEYSLLDKQPMFIDPRKFGVRPSCACQPESVAWQPWRNEAGSFTAVCAACGEPWRVHLMHPDFR